MDYKEIAQVLGIPEGTSSPGSAGAGRNWRGLLERNKREVM